MNWLFVGGTIGLVLRAIGWVIAWNLIGTDWHWLPHALVAWLLGDFIVTIILKIFNIRGR